MNALEPKFVRAEQMVPKAERVRSAQARPEEAYAREGGFGLERFVQCFLRF